MNAWALLSVSLLLAPGVLAHGGAEPAAFDPLVLNWPLNFARGELVEPSNDGFDGPIPFAATSPATPAEPLSFAYTSPVKHQLGQGLDLSIAIRAGSPVVTRDAEGDSFELKLLLDGEPIPDATQRVALNAQVMTVDQAETLRVTMQAPTTLFEEGALVTLTITPLMTLSSQASLFLTPSQSSAALKSMRVPTLADLKLQETNLTQFDTVNDSFTPREANARVFVGLVGHETIDLSGGSLAQGERAFVVLKGIEDAHTATDNHAFATRAKRVNASHEISVGTTLVRVVPGVGVVIPIQGVTSVSCVRNCPTGFRVTFTLEPFAVPGNGPTVYEDARDTLVPPPPATGGVAVSKDKPAEKRALGLPGTILVAALCAATLSKKRA